MWGNLGNFSDLAKAAEELQKQATSSMKVSELLPTDNRAVMYVSCSFYR